MIGSSSRPPLLPSSSPPSSPPVLLSSRPPLLPSSSPPSSPPVLLSSPLSSHHPLLPPLLPSSSPPVLPPLLPSSSPPVLLSSLVPPTSSAAEATEETPPEAVQVPQPTVIQANQGGDDLLIGDLLSLDLPTGPSYNAPAGAGGVLPCLSVCLSVCLSECWFYSVSFPPCPGDLDLLGDLGGLQVNY